MDKDPVAEWGPQRLVIEPRRQDAASERCKDLLIHAILWRMCANQEVRRILRRNNRDLCAALPRDEGPPLDGSGAAPSKYDA